MNEERFAISIALFGVAFFASLGGVALFTRWSLHRGVFDVPNERSSHSTPTPRGGGVIIVLVCLAGYLAIGYFLDLSISAGYLAGALLVAGVSWLDDLYSLPFWGRLIVHLAAAGMLIWDVGFWSDVSLPLISGAASLGTPLGLILTVIWLVWLLNAYNFMDGIDGIAALQAVVSCVAWAVVAYEFDLPSVFFFAGVAASASVGFLIHNWQPAKIFMGDVGSAFLGFTLAAMPLLAQSESRTAGSALPVFALVFVWPFVVDTVFTLVRRLLSRKRVWEAHREHIYQKLVIEGHAHSSVALLYGAGSILVSVLALLGLVFSGIYWYLTFLFILVLTVWLGYLGLRKNVDLNS